VGSALAEGDFVRVERVNEDDPPEWSAEAEPKWVGRLGKVVAVICRGRDVGESEDDPVYRVKSRFGVDLFWREELALVETKR
jgi:hypothetical protein